MNSKNGLIRNIILGIVGGFLGSFIFDLLGISFAGYLGTILVSVVGACLIILVVDNKYGMKFWTTLKASNNIICNQTFALSRTLINRLLEEQKEIEKYKNTKDAKEVDIKIMEIALKIVET